MIQFTTTTIPANYPSQSVKKWNADKKIREEALVLAQTIWDSLPPITCVAKENNPIAGIIITRSITVSTKTESLASHLLITALIKQRVSFYIHLPQESPDFSRYLESKGYNVIVVKQEKS